MRDRHVDKSVKHFLGDLCFVHNCYMYGTRHGPPGKRLEGEFYAVFLGEVSYDPWWGKSYGVKILTPFGVWWVLNGSIKLWL